MKRFKEAFGRWKAKHWDLQMYTHDEEFFGMIGFDRPPLRAFWERRKSLILKFGPWLAGLIGGAIILKLIGLA